MRQYRLQRIVAELQKRDLAGVLLFDPLNIRYATDSTNMQLWITHNHARACYVSATGHMISWDFHNCEHLSAHLPLVKELRGGASFFYFETGNKTEDHTAKFAAQIEDILQQHAGSNRRLTIDKIEIVGLTQLLKTGIEVFDVQEVMEFARSIKNQDEINAMRCSIASTQIAMHAMQEATVLGITEHGMSFAEVTKAGALLPKDCPAQRYGVIMHGVGLCDEYPPIRYPEDVDSYGYDGVLEPSMALCVEAYVGRVGGKEGVN